MTADQAEAKESHPAPAQCGLGSDVPTWRPSPQAKAI